MTADEVKELQGKISTLARSCIVGLSVNDVFDLASDGDDEVKLQVKIKGFSYPTATPKKTQNVKAYSDAKAYDTIVKNDSKIPTEEITTIYVVYDGYATYDKEGNEVSAMADRWAAVALVKSDGDNNKYYAKATGQDSFTELTDISDQKLADLSNASVLELTSNDGLNNKVTVTIAKDKDGKDVFKEITIENVTETPSATTKPEKQEWHDYTLNEDGSVTDNGAVKDKNGNVVSMYAISTVITDKDGNITDGTVYSKADEPVVVDGKTDKEVTVKVEDNVTYHIDGKTAEECNAENIKAMENVDFCENCGHPRAYCICDKEQTATPAATKVQAVTTTTATTTTTEAPAATTTTEAPATTTVTETPAATTAAETSES